jgi:hypothetical protein
LDSARCANWLVSAADPVPPTTLRGVALFTKGRRRDDDVFDIAITPEGIEILRPDQEAHLLEWSRVATWEIEQRRRRVLLTLRGGGSVTPLMIPDWKVDDLDRLLREMTAHLAPSGVGPEEVPPSALEVPAAPKPPVPEVDVELDDAADDDAGVEGEVHAGLDLELPAATPAPVAAPLGDMDLSLPAPTAAPETFETAKEMDLSLSPPPPVPDPVALARAADGAKRDDDDRSGGSGGD